MRDDARPRSCHRRHRRRRHRRNRERFCAFVTIAAAAAAVGCLPSVPPSLLPSFLSLSRFSGRCFDRARVERARQERERERERHLSLDRMDGWLMVCSSSYALHFYGEMRALFGQRCTAITSVTLLSTSPNTLESRRNITWKYRLPPIDPD